MSKRKSDSLEENDDRKYYVDSDEEAPRATLGVLKGADAKREGNKMQLVHRATNATKVLATGKIFKQLELKVDSDRRPLWMVPTGSIYLEVQSPYFQHATDFLVAIAEPVSRPECIHHYKLTPYSLYAAVSVNLTTETILDVLSKFSKNPVPAEVKKFIHMCTISYGKVKLILKRGRMFIESPYPDVLKTLLSNEQIKSSRIIRNQTDDLTQAEDDAVEDKSAMATDFTALEELEIARAQEAEQEEDEDDIIPEYQVKQGDSDMKLKIKLNKPKTAAPVKHKTVVNFEIKPEMIQKVKEAALEMNYPLMEEYDFRKDNINPTLPIDLTAKIRYYQEKSLGKMFGNGRARSGVIVLPCGAGKTLTGITACCTIKKSCIVFCTSGVAVEQWINSFKVFTTIKDDYIVKFTSDSKSDLHPSGATLLVTTYSMMSFAGERGKDSLRVMKQIEGQEWGLVLLDEVHVVPAKMFRKALTLVRSHAKLGLTATLVREDGLIEDLNFLIGPKLYEANWMKLTEDGFLAKVLCNEVWCPMTGPFYKEYLREPTAKRKELLYVMNPNKFATCKMLVEFHEKRNDKILVFSDNIPALKAYGERLRKNYMYGETPPDIREVLLNRFRGKGLEKGKVINTLLISKIGDVAIDLPEANVLIQISSHFGSRRQEAQRLGRILRPKPGAAAHVGFNAFFYTLISMDTSEMFYSNKRQQYLVDQGYTFQVIKNFSQLAQQQDSSLVEDVMGAEAQMKLIQELTKEKAKEDEKIKKDADDIVFRGRMTSRAPRNKLMRDRLQKRR